MLDRTNRPYPVLPIGKVNLETAKNAMFGTMWNCWEENATACNILVKEDETCKLKAIHTSGNRESTLKYHPVESKMRFKHDQTGVPWGDTWTVLGVFEHTKRGLIEMKWLCGKTGVSFATFK